MSHAATEGRGVWSGNGQEIVYSGWRLVDSGRGPWGACAGRVPTGRNHPGPRSDNEADVGGLENYPKETRPADWDTDHDGMPGEWETAHGLNPEDPADGNATTLSKVGYTNLEMYLNELAGYLN